VVSGYVGNKAAVFPMQLLGFDVSPLNSVQFSNHTGYGKGMFAGDVLNAEQLERVVDMMARNDLLHFSHILTGVVRLRFASFSAAGTADARGVQQATSGRRHSCDK
jgi:pyridoxal kinase